MEKEVEPECSFMANDASCALFVYANKFDVYVDYRDIFIPYAAGIMVFAIKYVTL